MQRIHLQHDFPFNSSRAANYQTNQRKIQLPLLPLLIQFKCLSQIRVASLIALLNAHAIQSKSQRKHRTPSYTSTPSRIHLRAQQIENQSLGITNRKRSQSQTPCKIKRCELTFALGALLKRFGN